MNYFFLKIFLLELIIKISYQDTLLWAFEIFRHGARSPYRRFQDNNSKDLFGMTWPGIQELTDVGKRQHFLIGYRNHQRYIEQNQLINAKYDPREVHIFSTNKNRTIESAASQLQGLYLSGEGPTLTEKQITRAVPPIKKELYNDILDRLNKNVFLGRINVVPIHILDETYKVNRLFDEEHCKGLKGNEKKSEQREEVKEFLKGIHQKYGGAKLAALVDSSLNVKEDCFLDYTCAFDILDTIISEYFDERDMTQIQKGLEIENMDNFINEICYKFFYYDLPGTCDETHDNAIYGMTKLFLQILDYMDLKIEKDKNGEVNYINYDLPKFVMHSGHDWTLSVFERIIYDAFNIEITYTYFASNAFLELYKAENGTYYVKYLYNDVTEKDFSYETFKNNILKVIKTGEEVDEFCGLNNDTKNKNNTFLIIFLIIFILLFIAETLYIIFGLRKAKLNNSLESLNMK